MTAPIASPDSARLPAQPFFSSPEQRVALARDRFFERGERPSGLVSEAVLQSWTRCVGARRNPAHAVEFDPVSRTRVQTALERNRLLVRVAEGPIGQLERALAGSGCRVLLADAAGVLVRAPAAPLEDGEPVLRCAARLGVSLDERLVGTNAPGLVLKTQSTVVVNGAEHFFCNTAALRCAAAPIRNGRGRLAGVLDLTIEGRPFGFDAGALSALYATLIENELMLVQAREAVVVRFQVCPTALEGSTQALAGIDAAGRLAWCNGAAQRLLGLAESTGVEVEPLFGVPLAGLLQRAGAAAAQPLPLPNGLTVWAQVAAPRAVVEHEPPAVEPESAQAPTPTLDEHTRQTILRVVQECEGNLSAAARRLGVSRGLLYRRLRERSEGGAS